jgi:hypothetical protein
MGAFFCGEAWVLIAVRPGLRRHLSGWFLMPPASHSRPVCVEDRAFVEHPGHPSRILRNGLILHGNPNR